MELIIGTTCLCVGLLIGRIIGEWKYSKRIAMYGSKLVSNAKRVKDIWKHCPPKMIEKAPRKIKFSDDYYEILIPIDTDNTASLYIDIEALKAVEKVLV